MASHKICLQEDEALAIKVEKYPCLYNKALKVYKENDRRQNAWREIEESLGYEQGNII